MQREFPKEIGVIQLNLISPSGFKHHFGSVKPAKKRFVTFDFVSVVQSCELVRFCLEHQGLYRREENRFQWVDEGLFFLKNVLSDDYHICHNEFYVNVKQIAVNRILEHPLCAAWKRIINPPISHKKRKRRN